MDALDGFRLGLCAAVVAGAVWMLHRRRIRTLSVPRRSPPLLGASLAAVVLGSLAAANEPGLVGGLLAAAGIAGGFSFVFSTFGSRLPSTQPAAREGEPAPGFTAKDETGRDFELAALRGKPVLLKFFRGHRSPYCVAELKRWERFRPQLELFGVQMVAVCPDSVTDIARMKHKHGLGMPIVSDASFEVTNLYNVRQERVLAIAGVPLKPLAIPTTFLIDANGIVRWVEQAHDYRLRSDIDRVMAAVKRKLARRPPQTAAARADETPAEEP